LAPSTINGLSQNLLRKAARAFKVGLETHNQQELTHTSTLLTTLTELYRELSALPATAAGNKFFEIPPTLSQAKIKPSASLLPDPQVITPWRQLVNGLLAITQPVELPTLSVEQYESQIKAFTNDLDTCFDGISIASKKVAELPQLLNLDTVLWPSDEIVKQLEREAAIGAVVTRRLEQTRYYWPPQEKDVLGLMFLEKELGKIEQSNQASGFSCLSAVVG